MPRIRILVLCALTACLIVPALPAAPAAASAEDQIVAKINAYRAKHGLPGVRKSKSLTRSAERYSWKMMRNGYFGHQSRIAASSKYRRVGEILAYTTRPRPSEAFRMWLNSPAHKALIVDRGFRYLGAGAASGRFRGRKATLWTVHFGAR